MIKRFAGVGGDARGGRCALAGCNTIEGAGKDIKAAGSAVEKAAGKSKPY